MTEIRSFEPPEGITFRCREQMPLGALSKDLCAVMAFLQGLGSSALIHRYDDWLQHDGLIFTRGQLDIHGAFLLVETPRAVFESIQGDDYVRTGLMEEGRTWYLRYFAAWTEDDSGIIGDYDITLSPPLVERFRVEVVPLLAARIAEESSLAWFKRITVA